MAGLSREPNLTTHEHWLRYFESAELPLARWTTLTAGAYMAFIAVVGTIGNLVLFLAFTCCAQLRSPSNLLVVNLAISDLGLTISVFPLSITSAFSNKWLYGEFGCIYYGVTAAIFGMLSIATMAAIAVDRYCSVVRVSGWRLTYRRSWIMLTVIWVFALTIATPPFFGWSHYILESMQISCTVDFFTQATVHMSYTVFVFCGYVLPLLITVTSYVLIIAHLIRHRNMMQRSNVVSRSRSRTPSSLSASEETIPSETSAWVFHVRATATCITILLCFFITWSPYAIISMIRVFGDQTLLTPLATTIPLLFSRSNVVYNPIIYALMNENFRTVIWPPFFLRGRLGRLTRRRGRHRNQTETMRHTMSEPFLNPTFSKS